MFLNKQLRTLKNSQNNLNLNHGMIEPLAFKALTVEFCLRNQDGVKIYNFVGNFKQLAMTPADDFQRDSECT